MIVLSNNLYSNYNILKNSYLKNSIKATNFNKIHKKFGKNGLEFGI